MNRGVELSCRINNNKRLFGSKNKYSVYTLLQVKFIAVFNQALKASEEHILFYY